MDISDLPEFFGFPLPATNDGLYCGKAQPLIGVILLHVLQSSCLVFLGKMTLAQHRPWQDQLSVTLKLDFIYILCARVDLERSLLLHPNDFSLS